MKLHLVIELAAPVVRAAKSAAPTVRHGAATPHATDRMPHLEKLIARGDATALRAHSFDQSLIAMFGYDERVVTPNAALLAHGEGLDAADHYWLRADPVCLAPTISRLTLSVLPVDALGSAESQALGAALREHLAAHGCVLFIPHPQRWYLRLASTPDLKTLSPADCAGTLQESDLPAGRDSPQWKRMITEVQMLLHSHPVNAAREAQGDAPANAIWPWGGGRLPLSSDRPCYDSVWSDDLLVRGLARATGITPHVLPPDAETVLAHERAGDNALVVLARNAFNEPQDAAKIDRAWAAPLGSALEAGQLGELSITAWAGRGPIARRIARSHLRRWWRRTRPLQAHG